MTTVVRNHEYSVWMRGRLEPLIRNLYDGRVFSCSQHERGPGDEVVVLASKPDHVACYQCSPTAPALCNRCGSPGDTPVNIQCPLPGVNVRVMFVLCDGCAEREFHQ